MEKSGTGGVGSSTSLSVKDDKKTEKETKVSFMSQLPNLLDSCTLEDLKCL